MPATLIVTKHANEGVGTLRYHAALAAPGDTIVFDPTLLANQTISLESPIALDRNLTIDRSTVSGLVISGRTLNRVFNVDSASVFLNSLTINDGKSLQNGGAVNVVANASLAVNGCFFSNSSASLEGGAIYSTGALSVTASSFVNNTADGNGAAIAFAKAEGSLTVGGSTFVTNRSWAKGGALSTGLTTTLIGCTFGGNIAVHGGAVSAIGDSPTTRLTCIDTSFIGNAAYGGIGPQHGGAIYTNDLLTVQGCLFDVNTAESKGGAIFHEVGKDEAAEDSVSVEIHRTSFLGNEAEEGGAVYTASYLKENANHILTVVASTFATNKSTNTGSDVGGGGLRAFANLSDTSKALWTFVNDTFFQNTSGTDGAALYLELAGDGTGTSAVKLTSLSVHKNTGPQGGAVVLDHIDAAIIHNSILSGNLGGNNQTIKDLRLYEADLDQVKSLYNLRGSNTTGFPNVMQNYPTDEPVLDDELAVNDALPGYPKTLKLYGTSDGYGTGDPAVVNGPTPLNLDGRGKTRAVGTCIGAYDLDGTGGGIVPLPL